MRLNKSGTRDLACACETTKQTMESEFMALLRDQQGRPVLSSKSCDGTPYVCCETSEYQIGLEHACQDQRKGCIRVSGKAPVCEGIGAQWALNVCFIPGGSTIATWQKDRGNGCCLSKRLADPSPGRTHWDCNRALLHGPHGLLISDQILQAAAPL